MRPYEQKKLFGFEENFKEFVDLYKKNTFPNKIIFSGKKGIGKSLLVKEFLNRAKGTKERNSIVSFIGGEDIVPIIRDANNKLIKT